MSKEVEVEHFWVKQEEEDVFTHPGGVKVKEDVFTQPGGMEVKEDVFTQPGGVEVGEDVFTQPGGMEVKEDVFTQPGGVEVGEDVFTQPGGMEVEEDVFTQPGGMEVEEDVFTQPGGMEVEEDVFTKPGGMEVKEDVFTQPGGMEVKEDVFTQPGGMEVEEDTTDSSLVITMEELNCGGKRKGVAKRKRRVVEQEDEESGANESEEEVDDVEIDRQLDQALESKSRQHNLTTINVRNIIHEVITNEHVVAMMKAAINETEEPAPVFEPTMTRSKFKEVVEKGVAIPTWNISPIKKASEVKAPQFVDIPLEEEDSSDEEYRPDEDEEDETAEETFQESDMESTASSPRGRGGGFFRHGDEDSCSPWQGSRHWPRHLRVESVSMGPPPPPVAPPTSLAPDSSFLEKLNAVEEELAVCMEPYQPVPVAGEGAIMGRTRSKRPLRDVPLGRLEAELRAPDFTPDMYDCSSAPEDRDWTNWLRGLMSSDAENDEEGDDEDDPEYNFLADSDEPDREDYRNDKAVRITKKEVNELMEEWFETLKDDLVGKDDEGHDEEEESQEETSILETHTLSPQSSQTTIRLAEMVVGLEKEPIAVSHTKREEPEGANEPFTLLLYPQQRAQLQQQVQQHIQLLTQVHMLTSPVSTLQYEALTTRQLLFELEMLAAPGEVSHLFQPGWSSAFRASNLQVALQLVEELHVEPIPYNPTYHQPTSLGRYRKYPLMPAQLAWLFATRPAFLYPELLPQVSLDPAHYPPRNAITFTPAEQCLVVLGLRNMVGTEHPAKMASHFLIRRKTTEQVQRHIFDHSRPDCPDNVIKTYKLHNILEPMPVACGWVSPGDMRPPVAREEKNMAAWLKQPGNLSLLVSLAHSAATSRMGGVTAPSNKVSPKPAKQTEPKPNCKHSKSPKNKREEPIATEPRPKKAQPKRGRPSKSKVTVPEPVEPTVEAPEQNRKPGRRTELKPEVDPPRTEPIFMPSKRKRGRPPKPTAHNPTSPNIKPKPKPCRPPKPTADNPTSPNIKPRPKPCRPPKPTADNPTSPNIKPRPKPCRPPKPTADNPTSPNIKPRPKPCRPPKPIADNPTSPNIKPRPKPCRRSKRRRPLPTEPPVKSRRSNKPSPSAKMKSLQILIRRFPPLADTIDFSAPTARSLARDQITRRFRTFAGLRYRPCLPPSHSPASRLQTGSAVITQEMTSNRSSDPGSDYNRESWLKPLSRSLEEEQMMEEEKEEYITVIIGRDVKEERRGERGCPVELYHGLASVLEPWPQLLRDYAAFLRPSQALRCGLLAEQQLFESSRRFLRYLELGLGADSSRYQEVICLLQEGPALNPSGMRKMKAKVASLLKSHTHLQEEFWVFFKELHSQPSSTQNGIPKDYITQNSTDPGKKKGRSRKTRKTKQAEEKEEAGNRGDTEKDGEKGEMDDSPSSPSAERPVCAKNISLSPSGKKVVLWTREADRTILTACQQRGANQKTFQAVSAQLGNKTAKEVCGRFKDLVNLFRSASQKTSDEDLPISRQEAAPD
ncbi:uncharacterized protein gon4la [Aplochiton taeniatus]